MDYQIDYVSPKELLSMSVEEYLAKYGANNASVHLKSTINGRLKNKASWLRQYVLGGKPLSKEGEPLPVWDLIRIPHVLLRKVRIGKTSLRYIREALEKNELRLNMSNSTIKQYIEDYDINVAKLRTVLDGICQQCINEKKKDFSRMYVNKNAIVPGFECYVLVTRV